MDDRSIAALAWLRFRLCPEASPLDLAQAAAALKEACLDADDFGPILLLRTVITFTDRGFPTIRKEQTRCSA